MTPKEKVSAFIERNLKAEKDKFGCGMRNAYYEWSDLKDEWEGFEKAGEDNSCLTHELSLLRKYLKENRRTDDYEEWRKKDGDVHGV